MCSVTQSCPTLSDPMNRSLPRFLCPWDSLGKKTGGGATPGYLPDLEIELASPTFAGRFFITVLPRKPSFRLLATTRKAAFPFPSLCFCCCSLSLNTIKEQCLLIKKDFSERFINDKKIISIHSFAVSDLIFCIKI